MVSNCWRGYELPDGRTPESFAYRVDEVWDGGVTDTLYTDDETEADRLVAAMLSNEYAAHVTHNGKTTRHSS